MVTVVVGGQYGSEGKGAFCAFLARRYRFDVAVRGGGPQAGHTFWADGKRVVRQVPVACVVDKDCQGYIGPGAVVNRDVLEAEIREFNLEGRIHVHPGAVLVDESDMIFEASLAKQGAIPGSTREGVGQARSRRALRLAATFGVNHSHLPYVDRDLQFYDAIGTRVRDKSTYVMAEGTQGYGLSLFHGQYPYVTSADTTPAAVLSECGLPVIPELQVVMVLRTFPIRVGGESGPLKDEVTWSGLQVRAEVTTVTKRERRVGRFDRDQFDRAVRVMRPTLAALMFCDYLDPDIRIKKIRDCPTVYSMWGYVNARVACPWIGVGGEKFEVRDVDA
jgi:adenylosuccinate synthase